MTLEQYVKTISTTDLKAIVSEYEQWEQFRYVMYTSTVRLACVTFATRSKQSPEDWKQYIEPIGLLVINQLRKVAEGMLKQVTEELYPATEFYP